MAFSLRERPDHLQQLRSKVFDLLVVGGGITGAGIARDAALRGLSVGLVERGDFASGTSSRSSKLIHGGLRYLEMGDVGLVFEAVRERQRLLQLAPHLTRPQSFVLPVWKDSKHGLFLLDVGLTVYDMLAAFAGVVRHRSVRRAAALRMEPLLRSDDLVGGVRYFDAMTDDGRLVMANIRGAVQAGAVCVSRASFVEPAWKANKLVGARIRDELRGDMFQVGARVIVSAAGPWTDELMGRWKGQAQPAALKPSKGVHVVVPRHKLPLSQAVTMTSPIDGRVVFALPWPDATVIGTTDTPYSGQLDEPGTTWEDADYLIRTTNAILNGPQGPLVVEDIVSTWAGIRPLVVSPEATSSYKTSREHVIATDPRGLVSIAGGKLTTYRVMAQQTVDAACKLLPDAQVAALKPCQTADLPLPGADALPSPSRPIETLTALLRDQHKQPPERAQHLAWQFGSDATDVLATEAKEPGGRQAVVEGLPVTWGELRWLSERELPVTLVDLCVRRCNLYYCAGDQLLPLAEALAQRFVGWLGLPEAQVAPLAAELHAYVATHRVQPPRGASGQFAAARAAARTAVADAA